MKNIVSDEQVPHYGITVKQFDGPFLAEYHLYGTFNAEFFTKWLAKMPAMSSVATTTHRRTRRSSKNIFNGATREPVAA